VVWSPYKIWLLFLIPCRGSQEIFGTLVPRPFRIWGVNDPLTPLYVVLPCWVWSSTVCASVGVPNISRTLGPRPLRSGRTCLTARNMSLPHKCYHGIYGRSRSNSWCIINYGNPPQNTDPSHPAFQGHSRSLQLTRIDRLPMTSC